MRQKDRTLSPLYARLNLRREAAELVLRMFQPSERRPREEIAMFRLVIFEPAEARGEGEAVFDP